MKPGTHFDWNGFLDFFGFAVLLIGPGLIVAGVIVAAGLTVSPWAAGVLGTIFIVAAFWFAFQVPD